MRLKGVKSETVSIDISNEEFIEHLTGLIPGYSRNTWIVEKSNNQLALFSDHGGSHYCEGEDRRLTDEEAEYYRAVQIIQKYINK